MTTLLNIAGQILLFLALAAALVVIDHKILVPLGAFLQKKEKRPEPTKRKGIAARRGPQPQFWLAVGLTLLSLWLLPTGEQSFVAFLVFVARLLTIWVAFLYSSRIVRGWERRGEIFASVGQMAEGGTESLKDAIAAGGEAVKGLRQTKETGLERLRSWVGRFLSSASGAKEEFDEVRRESVTDDLSAVSVPKAAPSPEPTPDEPARDPRQGIDRFIRGGKATAPTGGEG